MNDLRRMSQKYSNSFNKKQIKSLFNVDNALLDTMLSYTLTSNKLVKTYGIKNLNKFVDAIPKNKFDKNQQANIKFSLLKDLLDKRSKGITGDLLISDVQRNSQFGGYIRKDDNGNYITPGIRELSNEEVKYIDNTIVDCLNTLELDPNIERLKILCDEYINANKYKDRQKIADNIKSIVSGLTAEFRRIDFVNSGDNQFRSDQIDNFLKDKFQRMTDSSYKLITGMQGMNDILGGGLEKGRCYCFVGMSGEGKTVTAENLLVQLWKHNQNFVTKDPNKKPALVLLTMENLVSEYVSAIFSIFTQGQYIQQFQNADQAIQAFQQFKEKYLKDNNIELVIQYEPVYSKDTDYCYQLAESLEDEGYEVIGFFMDYLARIRPVEFTGDEYKDFGTVINEFKSFAMTKDIPVITFAQLNRTATKIIEEGRASGEKDILYKLGSSTLGDSINIKRNLDGMIILLQETSINGNRYMGYKLAKKRYPIEKDVRTIFYQPFLNNSTLIFEEDLHNNPKSRYTMKATEEDMQEAMNNKEKEISDSDKFLKASNKITNLIEKELTPFELKLKDDEFNKLSYSQQRELFIKEHPGCNPDLFVVKIPESKRKKEFNYYRKYSNINDIDIVSSKDIIEKGLKAFDNNKPKNVVLDKSIIDNYIKDREKKTILIRKANNNKPLKSIVRRIPKYDRELVFPITQSIQSRLQFTLPPMVNKKQKREIVKRFTPAQQMMYADQFYDYIEKKYNYYGIENKGRRLRAIVSIDPAVKKPKKN